MTVQEAKKQDLDMDISHMQVLKNWLGDSLTQKAFKKSIDIAIKCMEEVEQYRSLGTVEELKEAREKQVAKKPKKMEKDAINDLDTWVECSCGAMKKADTEKHRQMYCWKCGQLLKWEEEDV